MFIMLEDIWVVVVEEDMPDMLDIAIVESVCTIFGCRDSGRLSALWYGTMTERMNECWCSWYNDEDSVIRIRAGR